jgi:hypothetical protein
MAEAFSQQFCSVAPCGAGGRIVTGQRLHNCLVQVADGELTLIQAPSTLVAQVPVAGVEIVTPPTLRKVGTGVIIKVDGKLLAVEFDVVYRRQQAHAGRRRSWLSRFFGISDMTTLPKAMRLGRQLGREFIAALLAAGAADPTGVPALPPRA